MAPKKVDRGYIEIAGDLVIPAPASLDLGLFQKNYAGGTMGGKYARIHGSVDHDSGRVMMSQDFQLLHTDEASVELHYMAGTNDEEHLTATPLRRLSKRAFDPIKNVLLLDSI